MSTISHGEIAFGHYANNRTSAQDHSDYHAFIRDQKILMWDVSRHTAEYYGQLKAALFARCAPKTLRTRGKIADQLIDPISAKSLGTQENDLWIVAQAMEHNLVFVTNDKMKPLAVALRDIEPDFRIETDWAPGTGL